MAKKEITISKSKEKTEQAKKKVDELLKGIKPKTKIVVEEPKVSLEEKKTVSWLEKELDRLVSENEKLENELIASKEDYKKLFEKFNSTPKQEVVSVDDSELMMKIKDLFREKRG